MAHCYARGARFARQLLSTVAHYHLYTMERVAQVAQHLTAPAAGVGGNTEPWWDTQPGTKRAYSHQLGPDVEAWAPGRGLPVLVAKGARAGPTL